MKVDKVGKDIAELAGVVLFLLYFFGGIAYDLPPVASETLWGLCVFFFCIRGLTEKS